MEEVNENGGSPAWIIIMAVLIPLVIALVATGCVATLIIGSAI